jgi:hypothetical protein
MKKISINFILHDRINYFSSSIKELYNIDYSIKSQIRLNLLISNYDDSFEDLIENIRKQGLEVHVFQVKGDNNYLKKIQVALDNSNEYAISIDEDIFIPSKVWQYFITSLNILSDPDILFLSPIISSGIPSVDLFAEQLLTKEEYKTLSNFYIETNIPNIWGADYSSLNQCTTDSKEWNYINFYNNVDLINHHYRGVHPVRFSYDAQKFLNKICINNITRICNLDDFSIKTLQRPYFCNSVFGIRVDVWKKIINDKTLFKDEFDEVPLNLYMRNNKLQMAFINNGFAIHPSYNTINIYGHNYANLSDEFFTCDFFKHK